MACGYTHLTLEERCQIESLLKRGDNAAAIGRVLCRPERTIRREIARNRGQRGYRHHQAHTSATRRRSAASCAKHKMTQDLVSIIASKLREQQWSPEQISGWLALQAGQETVSAEWIYQHVWADKKAGGNLWTHLRHAGKKYNRRKGKTSGRGLIPGRIDIDQRPAIVEDKSRLGDWELDTVIGAGHTGAVVTAVDRHSKFAVMEKVENKSMEAVTAALLNQLTPHKDKVLTATADNGKEFAGHATLTKTLGAPVYFAKPYHSWERGLNEHTNGLLRQYLPKARKFDTLTQAELDIYVAKINNRPRKCLGFKTPLEVFSTSPPPRTLHC